MGCGKRAFANVAVPGPVRVPSQKPPRLSVNDKDDEITPEAVSRSPDIYLTAEKNSGKPQLGDRLMKIVWPIIASNGVPYLQMRSEGSYSTSGREEEGKDGVIVFASITINLYIHFKNKQTYL